MKIIFMFYFGFLSMIFLLAVVVFLIADKRGIDVNQMLKKDDTNKTIQQFIFPYFILFLINLFMYLLSTNL
ncbi:hypothetical protein [Brachyspira sp. G79]|uniref:hypothetical protein n=1 Tax=Brachyspira sp. G79 TaxID=1358104 RepID=UPI000BBC1E0F|nr:hypothetical protein [Brachyspira sp. G79]PCG20539.1 hypothetical protein KQ44_11435 [Brachyspira sp. G79]